MKTYLQQLNLDQLEQCPKNLFYKFIIFEHLYIRNLKTYDFYYIQAIISKAILLNFVFCIINKRNGLK